MTGFLHQDVFSRAHVPVTDSVLAHAANTREEEGVVIRQGNAWYAKHHALKDIGLSILPRSIYAFIGPSGCGKTTLLRCINRLNDLVPRFRFSGELLVGGRDVYRLKGSRELAQLRRGLGMVFQQPNPLPRTIIDNLMLPLREWYHLSVTQAREKALEKLEEVGLLAEVKDSLHKSALTLSGGQQQRLCIARALMLEPDILLLDEPCSALDPLSTAIIEDLLLRLKDRYTIIIVTHNLQQARRISDYMALFYLGEVVEAGPTAQLSVNPQTQRLADFLSGAF
ncbi:MAG: phosphate ABC transporter ATP-binding protein [Actinomycetes bacterium]|jgi:phosphate transport system ATP-binding protein|nr:phosphate ABC transporter ATP-binding protein [Actinomycetes bacterium]